ncbi:alkaline phosphatase family protein [Caulobacter sp.]|uniref:alkaline phosphatase PhoY n=1 Tax=Caulobacter sp. TaxID=78 RepID=UPI001B07FDF3|nr:alkaline phosphatase family protein [Caulobacter sp.]MBO9544206.1 alkaline phosphatase family protein [Caulobacter sp.]
MLTCGVLAAAVSVGFAAQAETKPDPKLVVVISIDQFSANLYAQHRGEFTGGLATLSSGVVYPNGYQSHAFTETCPGHSTLLTGKHPNKTGISANDWYDRATGKTVYCLADPTVTLADDPKGRAVSPANMVATTYGDWLKAVSPKSRVFGVSGKDRGAITMSGHNADGQFWYQPGFGFTTYVREGQTAEERLKPVAALNAKLAADLKKHSYTWDYAKDSAKRCKALEADYQTGDRKWHAGLPIAAATSDADKLRDLYASPYTDAATLELAQDLRETYGLGDGPQVDVLTVSLSATDFIGHRYGTRGPEMCDQIARLDDRLGAFLKSLDKVKGGVLVVLAADHGGADFAERLHDEGYDSERVIGKPWIAGLNKQLRADLGLSWDPLKADGGIDQVYVVGADGKTPSITDRARITAAALVLIKRDPAVAEAFDSNAILTLEAAPADAYPEEISVAERLRRSAYPGRVGDILVAFKPYRVPATPGLTYVSTHGSPWDYDRRVPILFWWKGATPHERVLPLDTVDIAPTIAAATGVKPPVDVDGVCRPLVYGQAC